MAAEPMTTPAVSVLMTAYNRERYIADAIESVLAQQFQDFELVITDNQSTDGTLAVARRYADADPRIRVFLNERNLGQFGNRNRAAGHARADLLKYHDSDDVLYPHCLDVMVSTMQLEPTAAAALSFGRTWPGGPCPMLLSPELAYAREFLGHGIFQCGPGGAIIRKSAFDAVGGFRDEGLHADYLLWLTLARRFPVALIPADLFWYRQHEQQEYQSGGAALDYARLNTEVWRALHDAECPLKGAALEQARRNQAANTFKQIWRDIKRRRFGTVAYRVRHAGLSPLEWARYLRRPRRDAWAGTPMGANGDVIIPRWVRRSQA